MQTYKISFAGQEVFFEDYSFLPASEQVEAFIENNRGKYSMEVFAKNCRPYKFYDDHGRVAKGSEDWVFVKRIE